MIFGRTPGLASGLFEFIYTVNSTETGFNIYNRAIAAGWNGVSPLIAHITNNGTIGSAGSYAFDTGAGFPVGTLLFLVNNSSHWILGAGGNGGLGGGNGGPALRAQYPITITNNGGIGGGGGGGGTCWGYAPGPVPKGLPTSQYAGGGGGAGYPSGSGQNTAGGSAIGTANNGTSTSGGSGGSGYFNWDPGAGSGFPVILYGGNGGGLGTAGSSSHASGTAAGLTVNNYSGGAGGACVVGNSFITWLATGSRYGAIT